MNFFPGDDGAPAPQAVPEVDGRPLERDDSVLSEQRSQILGLVGFILAGFVFVAAGVRSGDALTVVGSVLWIVSCLIWMMPMVRSREP